MSSPREILPMPRRAYSYLRFSSKRQAKGDSHRRQMEFAVELSKEQGWVLDDSFTLLDLGVSAFRGKNSRVGALAEFLAAVKSGRVAAGSVLIVESIDRLSREDVDDAYDLFRGLIRSGVVIATREPRRVYDRESCSGNMLNLLEPLFIMARAHEESMVKSMRSREAWKQRRRRARAEGSPHKGKYPAWLVLTTAGYKADPARERTVKTVFALAREGLGAGRIAAWLNARPKEHPPMGNCGKWIEAYVRLILRSRSALGEYQPRRRDQGGRVVADGSPVQGYYPAVVTEQEYLQAQAAVAGRKGKTGRPGEHESNLFTGLVWHAGTRESLCLKTQRAGRKVKRRYGYLMAYKSDGPRRCGSGGGFRYAPFEAGLVRALAELRPADVLPPRPDSDAREARISELTGRLVELDHRAGLLRARLADPATRREALPDLEETVGLVRADMTATARELDALKLESTTGRGETLGEVKTLLGLLGEAAGTPGEADLRRRVKARVKALVEAVWVLPQVITRQKVILHVQVYLRGGKRKYLRIMPPNPPPGIKPWDLAASDFRAGDVGGAAQVAASA
jgi:DNA invertase Pin-like site-specific DNA recombinase